MAAVAAVAAEAAAGTGAGGGVFGRSVTAMFRSQHVVLDSVPRKKSPSVVVSASS